MNAPRNNWRAENSGRPAEGRRRKRGVGRRNRKWPPDDDDGPRRGAARIKTRETPQTAPQFRKRNSHKNNRQTQSNKMAIKIVLLAATLAVANAGIVAPAAYAAAPAIAYSAAPAVSHVSYSSPIVSYGAPLSAAHAPAITSQSSNILRSFGNLGQVSTSSKTIDTPFSSVSKSDVRVSNPGLRIATHAAPIGYAAHAAPLAYAAQAAPIGYAAHAAPIGYAAHAAPIGYAAHAAPIGYAAHAAPIGYAAHAPAAIGVAYSAAPAVSHMSYQGVGVAYGW
ncbi:hypothetical protein NQ318_022488 [Aromia moschata]|uniref:Uncharacterized protein n=1 Tax=Aromia moschata TaxID=1265417 RepID=A0AAV8Z5A0_9CUCU|nr:hypothetical protein NQ318_022488 [Aromia moschata]